MIHLQLFWSFFIIGCFSFGGGYAMLPLIDQKVTSQGWMSTEQFTEVVGISGMLPGSIGMNAATFVGYETAGFSGSLVATLGMVLPSLLIIVLIGIFFNRFQQSKTFDQVFYGLRPVITGLIIYSAFKFALSTDILTSFSLNSIGFIFIFLLALGLLIYKNTHPVFVILISGIGGIILSF